ncbi:MAG: methyltransferase domain-containing protein, partial [Calditrichaeota bacterium]
DVKEYYGKRLNGNGDLRTSACCSIDAIPAYQKQVLSKIDDEILTKFYGCGSPIPPLLEGKVILDLGCGTGRDVYLASYFAGPEGHVIGVDMTEEQIEVAIRHIPDQMQRFGFPRANVSFRYGYIENLRAVDIADNSVDVVISNCVINLSPDKPAVFSEIFRVLKPGGELYFSDVFASRRVPRALKQDKVLYGECLAGAMYIEDFRRLLRDIGCLDYRVVSQCPITIDDPELADKIGNIDFYSMTIRAFKLDTLEDICEDYGQVAIYNGTIKEYPHKFVLDDHHEFEAHKPKLVCGNTASMLQETRYAQHFQIIGDRSIHFGPFDCTPVEKSGDSAANSCGC